MIDLDLSKYGLSVLTNFDEENFKKILNFFINNGCDFIEELLENYLDIFNIDYSYFVKRFKELNIKYNDNLIEEIKNNMNILDELYY